MTERQVSGRVITIHSLGATVRLDDGRIAAVSLAELDAHRADYLRALSNKRALPFVVDDAGCGRSARLLAHARPEPVLAEPTAAPVQLVDDVFEERLADYLRETQAWAPPDEVQPFVRHLTRKRKRAELFAPSDTPPGD